MSINGIVNGLKAGTFKNIVVLSGAGISTGAGIPDFRSPGGMYDTLQPELITASRKQRKAMSRDPTEVVSFNLFQENQFPYLEVRRPFILSTSEHKWKATLSHFFLAILHEKGLLRRIYTQNIDGLDLQLELSSDKLVHVHGTIGEALCEFCSEPYIGFPKAVRENIKNIYDASDPCAPKESTHIICKACHRPGVKPNTVLYGRDLPFKFFQSCDEDFPPTCSDSTTMPPTDSSSSSFSSTGAVDLLLVVGTSLTVYPANSLVHLVSADCPRVVVNTMAVGEDMGLNLLHHHITTDGILTTNSVNSTTVGSSSGGACGRERDHLLVGQCDEVFLALCVQLGWQEELFRHFDAMSKQGQDLITEYRRSVCIGRTGSSPVDDGTIGRADLKRKLI